MYTLYKGILVKQGKRLQNSAIPLQRHEPAMSPSAQPVHLCSPVVTATCKNQMSINCLLTGKSTH